MEKKKNIEIVYIYYTITQREYGEQINYRALLYKILIITNVYEICVIN